MLPALLLVLGCWRPDAYEPPAAPPEEVAVDVADAAAEDVDADAAPEGSPDEGSPDEGSPEEGSPDEVEDDAPPPFPAYAARTLQAPVSVVDDYGKLLAVITTAGAIVEVRGEEEIRTRVWCGSCTPAVEGWIQAHLVERTNASPTGGSK